MGFFVCASITFDVTFSKLVMHISFIAEIYFLLFLISDLSAWNWDQLIMLNILDSHGVEWNHRKSVNDEHSREKQ